MQRTTDYSSSAQCQYKSAENGDNTTAADSGRQGHHHHMRCVVTVISAGGPRPPRQHRGLLQQPRPGLLRRAAATDRGHMRLLFRHNTTTWQESSEEGDTARLHRGGLSVTTEQGSWIGEKIISLSDTVRDVVFLQRACSGWGRCWAGCWPACWGPASAPRQPSRCSPWWTSYTGMRV